MFEKYTLKDINRVIASDSMRETIKETLQPEEPFMCFNYTDYGGSFRDKIIIKWAKKNHPDNIICEDTSWGGENAVIFGDILRYLNYNFYEAFDFENLYNEEKEKLLTSAYEDIIEDIEIPEKDAPAVKDAILSALDYCGHPEPNMWDYSYDDMLEQTQDFLNELGYDINIYEIIYGVDKH